MRAISGWRGRWDCRSSPSTKNLPRTRKTSDHHSVYVVYLRDPSGDGKAGYYVGMTGLSAKQQRRVEQDRLARARRPPLSQILADQAALKARAKRELPGRLLELAAAHRLSVARISVRNQRWRWGSCSRQGHICLNWRLVIM